MTNEQIKPENMREFQAIYAALAEAVGALPPSEMFVNGKDSADGMTPEGERIYMDMLRKADKGVAKTMDQAVGGKPPGWSHPKRDYWTRKNKA